MTYNHSAESRNNSALKAARDSLPAVVNGAIAPFIVSSPALAASLGLAASALGGIIVYRQERFNDSINSILSNPDIFTDKVLQSSNFQDGLIVHLDTIFKLRGEEKLRYARSIFFNFAKSSDMPTYPLERYDDTLSKISDAGIRFIGFVDNVIPGIKEDHLKTMMRENNNPTDSESLQTFRKAYLDKEPLSTFVNQHIEDRVKKEASLLPDYSSEPLTVESRVRVPIEMEVNLIVSELEQLGIVNKFSYQTQGWNPAQVSGYNLTHYGRMFASVIRPERSTPE